MLDICETARKSLISNKEQLLAYKNTQVALMDRKDLWNDNHHRENQNESFKSYFITYFSTHHYALKKIFQKHWSVLKNDNVLGPVLPEQPCVIFIIET